MSGNYGIVDEGYDMMPGGGVRWSEFNPATGIRTKYTMSGNELVRETEYVHTQLLLDENATEANDSMNQRWGDGKIYARVPMNLAYSGYLGEATIAGDQKAIAKWMNDGDNRAFRTFEGRV
jgi:hypothetical protein